MSKLILIIGLGVVVPQYTIAQDVKDWERSINLELGQGLYDLDYIGKVWPSIGINYLVTIKKIGGLAWGYYPFTA